MTAVQLWVSAGLAAMVFMPLASRAEGAIAHGADGGNGISYNYDGQRAADRRALEECSDDDCRIVRRFRHACGAVAKSRGGYGYAVRDSQRAAMGAAMEECESRNDGCRPVASGCDE